MQFILEEPFEMLMKRSCISFACAYPLHFPCKFSSANKHQMLMKSLCDTKELVSPNSSHQSSNILPKCTEPWHCKAFRQNRNYLIFSSKVWQKPKEAAKSANTRMSHTACAGAAEAFMEAAFRERHFEWHRLQGPLPSCQQGCGCVQWGTAAPHGKVQHPTGRCSTPEGT